MAYVRTSHITLFTILILLAIIEGCIASWLTARYNSVPSRASNSVRERTYFLLFVSWWTVAGSLLYLLMSVYSSVEGNVIASVASHAIFLTLTWIFWTSGAIAITVALNGGNNCSSINHVLIYCNQLNALEGFAWASFIIITFLLGFVFWRGVGSFRRGDGARGSILSPY